jgi:pimeloyl-ACP methyl ester carboxylesterase
MAAPTIVLVHGAFADASSWSKLYPELAGDGLTVLAPPNPLRGVTVGDGEYIKGFVSRIDGPVVLVGHSYGGAVITYAGTADNVVGLVYVDGFAPDEGEDLGSIQQGYTPPAAGPYLIPTDTPEGVPEFHIDPAHVHEVFCADLSAEEAAFIAISQRPLSGAAFGEKTPAAAWRSKPTWAIYGSADGAIDPGLLAFFYERAGAETTVVEGGSHCLMLSEPAKVADVVRAAVSAAV